MKYLLGGIEGVYGALHTRVNWLQAQRLIAKNVAPGHMLYGQMQVAP